MAERPDRPFDTTLRQLVRADPRAWLALAGRPSASSVDLLDTNVSALQAQLDAAIRVGDRPPWVAHLEFQSGYDPELPGRIDHYNHLLGWHHRLPVVSTAVLLRPQADGPALNGELARHGPDGVWYRRFRYEVVRLWQRPLEELLEGPLALLPLAPLVELFGPAESEADRLRRTEAVVRRLAERVRAEAPPDRAPLLWSETFFVLGLRYPREIAGRLLQGVRGMRDSLTYQAVLEDGRAEGRAEGRLDEARRLLRQVGERRFGPPGPDITAAIEGLAEVERVEQTMLRALDATSWAEALGERSSR